MNLQYNKKHMYFVDNNDQWGIDQLILNWEKYTIIKFILQLKNNIG